MHQASRGEQQTRPPPSPPSSLLPSLPPPVAPFFCLPVPRSPSLRSSHRLSIPMDSTEDDANETCAIIDSALDITNGISVLTGFHPSYKADCVRMVRKFRILQPFFEEMKEAPPIVSQPVVDALRTLEKALTSARELLLSCIHGSKVYLVLQTESIMKEFTSVSDEIVNALKRMPWNLLDVSEGVQEQVIFVEGQFSRAKGQSEFGDWQLQKDLMLAMTCVDETHFDTALLQRVTDKLQLKTPLELDAEVHIVRNLIRTRIPKADKTSEQVLEFLLKLRKASAEGTTETETVSDEESSSSSAAESTPIIPNEYLCPISLELMQDPVIVATGQTYERVNIEKWLERNRTCPKTQQVLPHTILIPNFVLRSLISQWCEANGLEIAGLEVAATTSSVRGTSLRSLLQSHVLSGERGVIDELVDQLQSGQLHLQRTAAAELRLLAKHSVEERLRIAEAGAIPRLVDLLSTNDPELQENAVTGLLNLSIHEHIKGAIVHAGAIPLIVRLLEHGSMKARENAAAALFSLSTVNENKLTIGALGAIPPLVDLLKNGSPQGKRDSALALFSLLIYQGNKPRAARAGLVSPLLDMLMDPSKDMMDEAASVLAILATHEEGRKSIGSSHIEIALITVLQNGSPRSKENAAATLLALSLENPLHLSAAGQMGVKSLLIELKESGTRRARRKASILLEHLAMLQAD